MMRIRSPRTVLAQASVVHSQDVFVGTNDEVAVYTELAEIVHDHGVAATVLLRKDAVQQRRLCRRPR